MGEGAFPATPQTKKFDRKIPALSANRVPFQNKDMKLVVWDQGVRVDE